MVADLFAKALLLLQLGSGALAVQNASRPLYKNPHAPVEARVSDLLSRMTVEDKMAQLMQGAYYSLYKQSNDCGDD